MHAMINPWLIAAALMIVGLAVKHEALGGEPAGWIITLGSPLQSETACQLDLVSLANVVPSRTRLQCRKVNL